MNSAPFPVDVSTLAKGSFIAPEVIEDAYRTKRHLADYSLKVMRCIDEIYRQLGLRGSGWVIRQREHGVRILTDSEAAVQLDADINAGLRQVARSHMLQQAVDIGQLGADEAARHERCMLRGAAFAQAIAATRKRVRSIAPPKPAAIQESEA